MCQCRGEVELRTNDPQMDECHVCPACNGQGSVQQWELGIVTRSIPRMEQRLLDTKRPYSESWRVV